MKEIVYKVSVSTDNAVESVKELDSSIESVNEKTEEGTQANEKSAKSLSDVAKASGLFNRELSLVNRVKGVYNTGMSLFNTSTVAAGANVSALSRFLGVLRVALISTGIGAIAVAVGTLAAAFLSTQRGVDALNSVLIPLQTTIQRVWGVLQNVASFLVDGEWNQAIRAILGLRTEMREAWRDGQSLNEMKIALRESTIAWITEEARLNQVVAEGREQIREESIALEERERILNDVLNTINKRAEAESALIQQEIDIHKIRMAQNDDDAESREELARLEARLINIQTSAANERRRIARDRQRLHRERIQQEEREMEVDLRKTDIERTLALMRAESLEEQKNAQIAFAKAERDRRIIEAAQRIEDTELWFAELELIREEHEEKVTGIHQEYADKRLEIESAEIEARQKLQLQVAEFMGAVSRLFGEQTAAGKALAIVQATIDTYVGANKALAQGGLFGIAGAATVIATGLANVRQILNTKIPSFAGGTTATPVVTSGSNQSPQFSNIEGGGLETVETVFSDTDREVVGRRSKVFVSETDISDVQNRVRTIESDSTF